MLHGGGRPAGNCVKPFSLWQKQIFSQRENSLFDSNLLAIKLPRRLRRQFAYEIFVALVVVGLLSLSAFAKCN